ncbi:hypothetical protein T459_10274 [Capsicum annuum]|uniref:Uncharacterized protein n=1 Tax=Capsicum annuum TaxID=4072 RepID=A0A2G3A1S1_CAPAN|nr:hypothetical protein T459_10274 [Capsicum annuum]
MLKSNLVFYLQTSSIKIKCVCDRADGCVMEIAAVSAAPPNGGPEQLAIFVVLKEEGMNISPNTLNKRFSKAIQSNLNPLFKVCTSSKAADAALGVVALSMDGDVGVLGPLTLNPERLGADDVDGTDEELLCRLFWNEEVWNWSDG